PLKTSRNHAWLFHTARRHDSRVSVIGPLPLTTCQNSSQFTQSSAPHSHPSPLRRRSGSGTLIPTSQSFGTYVSKNSLRSSSFDFVLIPQWSKTSFSGFDGGP